jgi:anhydro-N-acetylmuramic acid kinase
MSGSSLDGLDICFCRFEHSEKGWTFSMPYAETHEYSSKWKNHLKTAYQSNAKAFVELDKNFGELIGQKVVDFIRNHQIKHIDFVASHGHTVFHNPGYNYTSQIGSGAHIAAIANLPSITNFRSLDTALGGQGAPLVPIGDELLFAEYDFCLNLGGYSNISYKSDNKRIAYDICPVNKALNYLAEKEGREFDENGEIGRKGKVNKTLLEELNAQDFYQQTGPKSLGDEWLHNNFFSLLEKYRVDLENADIMRTVYEHIAIQIANVTKQSRDKRILATGGGAHNQFLTENIRNINSNYLIIPEKKLIDFKESLIFALMGALRAEKKTNCLASVTGAKQDSSGGIIYYI